MIISFLLVLEGTQHHVPAKMSLAVLPHVIMNNYSLGVCYGRNATALIDDDLKGYFDAFWLCRWFKVFESVHGMLL
jgi:hypothetical protein